MLPAPDGPCQSEIGIYTKAAGMTSCLRHKHSPPSATALKPYDESMDFAVCGVSRGVSGEGCMESSQKAPHPEGDVFLLYIIVLSARKMIGNVLCEQSQAFFGANASFLRGREYQRPMKASHHDRP